MKFIIPRVALLLFVTLATFTAVNGQDLESQYWYPAEPFRIEVDRRNPEVRELLERWDRIGTEAQGIANSFAGTYLKSGYRGWLLRWAPGAGFVYVYHYEGLSIIDFSYGKVEVTPSEIRFIPERDMRETFREYKLRTPLTWIAAQAPKARFMIPKEEMKDFGEYVAGLRDFNDFNGPCCEFDPFFVAPASTEKTAQSISAVEVPNEYQRFVRRPITGRIVSIGKRRVVKTYGLEGNLYGHLLFETSLTPIAIDAGSIHGLRKNMLLRLVGDQFNLPGQYIRVTSVTRKTASAVLIRDLNEKQSSFPPIQPGMRFTTSPILNN